ncbi:MAG: PAS domain-containing sensor histidine kinase [Persicimonas sp.]
MSDAPNLRERLSFEFIVEAINEGILVSDLRGEVLYVNERLAEMLGYEPADIIGSMLFDFMSPNWADRARENLDRRARGVAELLEHEFRHRDGRPIQTLVATRPIRVTGQEYEASLVAITDISERARAIDQLRLSEETFRTLSENSPEGIVIHRAAKIVYANPATADLLGYASTDALVGKPFEALVPSEKWPQAEQRIAQLGEDSPFAGYIEQHLSRKDGGLADVEIAHFKGVYHGEPSVISLLRDMTRRKRLMARTMQFDRLVVAGTLAAGVGHEVNNPLAFIKGHVDYAQDAIADSLALLSEADLEDTGPEEIVQNRAEAIASLREVSESLNSASRGADRIRDIIRDLRLFSRDDKQAAYPIAPRDILETTIQMAAHQLPPEAQLVRDYEEVGPALGYEAGLGQVLLNVLINAAHAIEDAEPGAHQVRARIFTHGERVCIEIEDTGVGIAEQHRQRIFDPFYTTKDPGTGTGLGLSISKKLIERMGGELLIDSKPGRGTRVSIWLDAAG